jgi:hypothetical protein
MLLNGAAVAAAASSAEPKAVMSFCSSMVKVVIIVLLCAALCAVTTFITPIYLKRKAILNKIDDGEGLAMPGGGEAMGDNVADETYETMSRARRAQITPRLPPGSPL